MRSLYLLLILFSSLSFAANPVSTYGPSVVELMGYLDLQTFPGPPNYESVGAGDNGLWDKFRKLGKGTHVKIQGTLFHRFTGHHHSRVLMIAESVQAVEKK